MPTLILGDLRLEDALSAPGSDVEDACCLSGENRDSKCRGLGLGGALDGDSEQIGLELHQKVIARRAAIYAKPSSPALLPRTAGGGSLHCFQ